MRLLPIFIIFIMPFPALAFSKHEITTPTGQRLEATPNIIKDKIRELLPLPHYVKLDVQKNRVYAQLTIKFN